jgi:hypothetical protein
MIYEHHPGVLWGDVDGTLVLCHTDTAEYFELNPVGAAVWRSCDRADFPTILGLLRETYPHIAPARLTDDARSYIAALVDAGILRRLAEE